MPIDLTTCDPAELEPSAELDQFLAERVMGWRQRDGRWEDSRRGLTGFRVRHGDDLHPDAWQPSLNPAHALLLLWAARETTLRQTTRYVYVQLLVKVNECAAQWYEGKATHDDTPRGKSNAMALAICRAWVTALRGS